MLFWRRSAVSVAGEIVGARGMGQIWPAVLAPHIENACCAHIRSKPIRLADGCVSRRPKPDIVAGPDISDFESFFVSRHEALGRADIDINEAELTIEVGKRFWIGFRRCRLQQLRSCIKTRIR